MLVVSNRKIANATYFAEPLAFESYMCHPNRPEVKEILFAFWSHKVPKAMLENFKCYGLHTGFLLENKGKGGSPIDNLQALGIKWAALNVFEMTEKFDGGRVVLAIPFNIDASKEFLIRCIDVTIPSITAYLEQDISHVPETFKRMKDAR